MKKIYIAGAGGMLGEALYNTFKNDYITRCIDKNKTDKWIRRLNFNTNKYFLDVIKFKPDYLFHIGALTDLEYCEKNKKIANITNYKSVITACKKSKKLNIPLIFISTAGIFAGKKNIYSERDIPKPLSVYGKTKYKAEIYIKKNIRKHIIIRPGWMMGGGLKKDKKFVKKILEQLISGNKKLFIVNDKLGTPTYTYDLAHNLKLLISKKKYGLFHMVCKGYTSRLDVCKEILNFYNLQKKVKLIEVGSNYFSKKYFAERPISERLVNKKLNNLKMNKMRNWKICLNEYLKNDFKKYEL